LSLASEYTPSALAEELVIRANKVRGITGLDVVPMLVVEGPGDESALSPVCVHGYDQIFVAGGRRLVEQLLSYLKNEPIAGCECVFLIDCDGEGKTAYLSGEDSLLVTETCDLEADLVHIGVAARVASRFLSGDDEVKSILTRSCELALAVSVVRRAAHSAAVSMRHANGRQFRITDLPDETRLGWLEATPDPDDILVAVAARMGFTSEESSAIRTEIPTVRPDFASSCMGKDALDVLFERLKIEGHGEVRGWDCHYFHKSVFSELTAQDLRDSEVGRRLLAWEASTGRTILR